jgi:hypothetical protein
MPRLPGGDISVTLTEVQYRLMEKWAIGEFEADWVGHPPKPPALDDIPIQDQPAALDRAALESCAGGGVFPGIEAGRLMRETSTYDQNQPLRISLQLAAGALTAGMAVPWQADFRARDEEDGSDWWPVQRPVEVFRGQEQVNTESPISFTEPKTLLVGRGPHPPVTVAGSIPRLPTPRERTRPTSSPSLCSCKRCAFGAEEEGFEPSIPR